MKNREPGNRASGKGFAVFVLAVITAGTIGCASAGNGQATARRQS